MRWGVAAGILIAAAIAFGGIANANPPVEAFGSLPALRGAKISPDGKYFAAIQSLNGRPAAVIYQIGAPAGAVPVVYTAEKDWLIESVLWLRPDRLLIYSKTFIHRRWLYTMVRAVSVGVNGEAPVGIFSDDVTAGLDTVTGVVADFNWTDPTHVLMPILSSSEEHDFSSYIYRLDLDSVDVYTGETELMQKGFGYVGEWFTDGQGKIVAREDTTDSPLTEYLWSYNGTKWQKLLTTEVTPGGKSINVEGISLDGHSAVIDFNDGADYLGQIDLTNGKAGPTVFKNAQYDVDSAITDEWTLRVTGATYTDDRPEFVYFDQDYIALQKAIEAAFPGQIASVASATRDKSRVIVAVESPRQPPSYYYLNRTTHQATLLGSQYPDLTADDLGEMKPYSYKARDGLDIHAYVTFPPGRAARNLPLVVLPHGGPVARDAIGFDWWAQFLANRGYAVLQPNYRGSSGYGKTFTEAGLKQWGLKMQDDITDGVNKLVADGVADPKRVCIVGASYGGYAALAGATFTPDLYACAVSISGVSDLERILRDDRFKEGYSSADPFLTWALRIGDIGSKQLEATSPALHAGDVKIPILLMHGKKDTTVPYVQSEIELEALQKAGKNVRLVTFDSDDHYMTLALTRIQMLKELETFLDKNIGH